MQESIDTQHPMFMNTHGNREIRIRWRLQYVPLLELYALLDCQFAICEQLVRVGRFSKVLLILRVQSLLIRYILDYFSYLCGQFLQSQESVS